MNTPIPVVDQTHSRASSIVLLLRFGPARYLSIGIASLFVAAASAQVVDFQDWRPVREIESLSVDGDRFDEVISFSPDGQCLAVNGKLGVRVFRVNDGQLLRQFSTDFGFGLGDVAFSEDWSRVASSSHWGISRGLGMGSHHIMNPNGRLIGSIPWYTGHYYNFTHPSLSPDGRLFAHGLYARVSCWDTPTGTLRFASSNVGGDRVRSVAFSPDGTMLATGGACDRAGKEGSVELWATSTGSRVMALAGPPASVTALSFSHDGKMLGALFNNEIRIWGIPKYAIHHRFLCNDQTLGLLKNLRFSPDGKCVAVATEQTVRIWRIPDATFLRQLDGNSIAFDPIGQFLATGGKTIRIWSDIKSLAASRPKSTGILTVGFDDVQPEDPMEGVDLCIKLLGKHPNALPLSYKYRLHPAEDWLPAVNECIHLSDLKAGNLTLEVRSSDSEGGESEVLSRSWHVASNPWLGWRQNESLTFPPARDVQVCYSPEGKYLAVLLGAEIKLLETSSWRESHSIKGEKGELFTCADFSPDGSVIAAGGHEKITFWHATNGKKIRDQSGLSGNVMCVAFSSDGALLSVGTDSANSGMVWNWHDLDKWEFLSAVRRDHPIDHMKFQPSGDTLIVIAGGAVELWKLRSTEHLTAYSLTGYHGHVNALAHGIAFGPYGLAFSPDALTVATCAVGSVRLWRVSDGKLLHVVTGYSPDTGARGLIGAFKNLLSFSPDGAFLAVGGQWEAEAQYSVRVIRVVDGVIVRSFPGCDSPISSVAFKPNGEQIAFCYSCAGNQPSKIVILGLAD